MIYKAIIEKQEVGLYLDLEGPNLGKTFVFGGGNSSDVLRSLMAPELIFLEEELAVTTPRQKPVP